jgi:peptide/nickel transport system permease protein
MLNFIIKRILHGITVLFGVVIIIFLLFNVMPDPARMMLGQRADLASVDAINSDLGRNQSITKRFLLYLNDLSPISINNYKTEASPIFINEQKYGNYLSLITLSTEKKIVLKSPYLRRSYQSKKNVSEILMDALPGTAVLAFSAMLFATIIGILLGIIAAIKKNTLYDRLALILSGLGTAAPSFFVAVIIAWIFAIVLHRYTGLNWTGSLYRIDPFEGEILDLKNLILPTIALGIRPLSIIMQLSRSSMLDVLSQDYIRTATAKGLSRYTVIIGHALKNALNPVLTAVSGWLASLLAGAFFVETIFSWHGIGKVTVDALGTYDFPVVMGAVLFVAMIFVIINILLDIAYGMVDPRVRVTG